VFTGVHDGTHEGLLFGEVGQIFLEGVLQVPASVAEAAPKTQIVNKVNSKRKRNRQRNKFENINLYLRNAGPGLIQLQRVVLGGVDDIPVDASLAVHLGLEIH
jgi:hypothetical protein